MNPEEPTLLIHQTQVRSRTDVGGLSTIIFCAKIKAESESASVLQAHRRIVEAEVNSEAANVTGILIGQGNSILHLLEGPSDSVVRILANLSGYPLFSDTNVQQSGRIVYSVEDRPQRYFPEWFSCTIQEKKSAIEDVTTETCKDIVHDVATGLLDVGRGLQTEGHEEVEMSRYADRLPGKNLILALSNSNDFFTLEEFVDLYGSPYHVELDSESSWPIERLVQY